MAKQADRPQTQPAPARQDVNPDLAFRAAWNQNTDKMREVLTEDHRVRSNLRPSQIKQAQEILRRYGLQED